MSDDLKKEMIGIGLIGLFIFVMASLLSYHPLDPSFNTLSSGPVKNWCGRAGSYIGDALMQLFGIMSYCLAAYALVFAVFYVKKRPHRTSWCCRPVSFSCFFPSRLSSRYSPDRYRSGQSASRSQACWACSSSEPLSASSAISAVS